VKAAEVAIPQSATALVEKQKKDKTPIYQLVTVP
jgi:hypothetical protein